MKFFVKNIDGVTIRLLFGLSMLILLSLIFWKQRVFVLDAAFQSFSIVAAKDYAFQVQRYGAVLVQSVPVLFAKLGLPLKVILAGYSLSFTIYPVLFFGYLLLLKEKKYAWSLALFYLVLTYHTFFWIQSELIQSASLAILCIGTLSSKVLNKYLKLLLVASLLLLCIYTHPLAIVSLMYLSAYQYFDLREHEKEDEEKRRPFVVLTILSLVTFVVKQFIIGTGKYDETAVASAQNVFVHIWNFFDLPSWHRFITHILENYHFIPILFFYITYKFVKKKKYIKLAMVWLGVWAWLILILTTTYYATEQFYIESYYLIVGYMLVIPFVVDLFHTMSTKVQNRLITFLIVYRLVMIIYLSFHYTKRMNYIEEMVAKVEVLPNQRFLIDEDKLDKELLRMHWGLPYSSLMISVIDGPDNPKTISYYKDNIPDYVKQYQNRAFMTPWGPHRYQWIKSKAYFNFTDTDSIPMYPE